MAEMVHQFGRRQAGWVCVAALLPVTALAGSLDRTLPDGACGGNGNMLEATRIGHAMLQQALSTGMPWGDKALNEYINRLGQNLARSSGSQQVFEFYVVYDPRVNAQSFPGGYIIINSGVISLAESEAELASVLSHEIAHENSCDWRTVPWREHLFELVAVVPTVVFGGPVGMAVLSVSGLTGEAARARSNRQEEERADRLAAYYLVQTGYDPRAAANFFERFQAEQARSGGEPSGLLATHPRTADRRRQLEKIIPNLPRPDFTPHDETEFLRMRKAVRDYDEIYSQVVGVRVPGHDTPPPALSHRPPSNATP